MNLDRGRVDIRRELGGRAAVDRRTRETDADRHEPAGAEVGRGGRVVVRGGGDEDDPGRRPRPGAARRVRVPVDLGARAAAGAGERADPDDERVGGRRVRALRPHGDRRRPGDVAAEVRDEVAAHRRLRVHDRERSDPAERAGGRVCLGRRVVRPDELGFDEDVAGAAERHTRRDVRLDVAGDGRVRERAAQSDDGDADHLDGRVGVVRRVRADGDRGRAGEGAVDLRVRVAGHLCDRQENVDRDAAGCAAGSRGLRLVRCRRGDEHRPGGRDVARGQDIGFGRAAVFGMRNRQTGGEDAGVDVDRVRLDGVRAVGRDRDAAAADRAVGPGGRARDPGEGRECNRAADAGADSRLDGDRERRCADRVGRRDGQPGHRAAVAEENVADGGGCVAAHAADRHRRAGREGAGRAAERVDLDRPVGGRRHEDAAAGLVDRRAVVDVRVLRAGVVQDDDLRAEGDESTGAREGEAEDVLGHRCLDGDVARAACAGGDARAGADARLGRAVDVHHEDGRADADEAAGDRARDAVDREVVVRANVNPAAGDDGSAALDRCGGAGGNRGRQRVAGDVPGRRRARERGLRARQRARDAAVRHRVGGAVQLPVGAIVARVVELPLGVVRLGIDAECRAVDLRRPVLSVERDDLTQVIRGRVRPRARRRDVLPRRVRVAAEGDLVVLRVRARRPRSPAPARTSSRSRR